MQANAMIQALLDAIIVDITNQATAQASAQQKEFNDACVRDTIALRSELEAARTETVTLANRVRELERLHIVGVQGDNEEVLGHLHSSEMKEEAFAEHMSTWLGRQLPADSELSQWADAFVQERSIQDEDDVERTVSNMFDGREFAEAVQDAVDNLSFEVRVSR